MKKKLLFVYNPNAGKKKIYDYLGDILNNLSEEDMELIVSPTKKRGDAEERVKEYAAHPDCYMIVCAGGDGTLHEVVNGMMKSTESVPIVYMPAGSTNDFGKSLHLPGNMLAASDMAKFGMPFPIDIASFNNSFFVYTACFGLFTETSYATPQTLKNVLGHFAYILRGSTELIKVKKYQMKVIYTDKQDPDTGAYIEKKTAEGTFIFGAVCSTSSIGGMKAAKMADDVRFDDGLYEMLLVRDMPVTQVPFVLNNFINGDAQSEYLVYAQVKYARFLSENEVDWCEDGEFAGSCTDSEIVVHHKAVTLMV